MKFLFIRFSSIGDIVLTSPVVRCVKQQVKDAEIHFLTKRSYSDVIENNPYIDKKFYFDSDISEVFSQLKNEKYDAIIDLQKNFRSLKLKRSLGIKSFTFNKLNIEKWLLVNFKINRLPNVHIVDRYMKAVESFGVKNDGAGLDYFITQNDEKVLNQLPESHRANYIGWVIGAKHATKRLPLEKMIAICNKIKSPIVLLGGKEDFETGELLVKAGSEIVFNTCGKFSLNESAALVKHSKKIITHDTGLMHIAAAFKKEIISIWGNTIPEFGMFPYFGSGKIENESSIILQVKSLSCRPCSKIGFEKCPKKHFNCMHHIDESIFSNL